MKALLILALLLCGSLAKADNVYYSGLTFTAVGGSANGVTVVAAVAGKTIVVVGWGMSTNSAGSIILHHQGGAAVKSNAQDGNVLGGGYFGVNGGERATAAPYCNGLAVNQPVCADFSGAMTVVYVWVQYRLQ
jgi:hypothetical protein